MKEVVGIIHSVGETPTPAEAVKTERQLMAKAANSYLNTSVVADFNLWPVHDKMSCFVRTPKAYVKKRSVGGITIPYVSGHYAMKVLNFIFNFDVSQEITDMKLSESSVPTKNGPKKAWLGAVTCKFTFHDPRTNRDIIRMVRSSHQMFESPATTADDAIKAAITKSWTLAGKSFGLFSDIKEEQAYERVEANVETGEIKQAPKKEFLNF